jgi:hypothetical protein
VNATTVSSLEDYGSRSRPITDILPQGPQHIPDQHSAYVSIPSANLDNAARNRPAVIQKLGNPAGVTD